jgi:hypothetical protein
VQFLKQKKLFDAVVGRAAASGAVEVHHTPPGVRRGGKKS